METLRSSNSKGGFTMTDNTVCIRCGKTRIVEKTWTENLNGSILTFTNTVCPDSECQKIVNEELQNKKDKINKIQKESLKRRMKTRKNQKLAKKIKK